MLNCIIVDDESHARSEIRYTLKKYNDIRVVGEAANALDALKLVEEYEIDLMFVDIQMPKISGIELADIIMTKQKAPKIIFVTAYDEFAIPAFKVNAIDYLLKPIDEHQFDLTIQNKVYPLLSKTEKEKNNDLNILKDMLMDFGPRPNNVKKLTVNVDDKMIPVNFSKIVFATVDEKEIIIQTLHERYSITCTLNELENRLNDVRFFRSHRSYIINTHYVDVIEPWFNSTLMLKMKHSEHMVPVSRSYVKQFKSIMNID